MQNQISRTKEKYEKVQAEFHEIRDCIESLKKESNSLPEWQPSWSGQSLVGGFLLEIKRYQNTLLELKLKMDADPAVAKGEDAGKKLKEIERIKQDLVKQKIAQHVYRMMELVDCSKSLRTAFKYELEEIRREIKRYHRYGSESYWNFTNAEFKRRMIDEIRDLARLLLSEEKRLSQLDHGKIKSVNQLSSYIGEAKLLIKKIKDTILMPEKDALTRLHSPWQKLEEIESLVALSPVSLSSEDNQLCREWANGDDTVETVAKMRSARIAERVAHELYSKLYEHPCDDLAILQIRDPENSKWKKADIKSKYWIDVKNTRTSARSSDTYSQWHVKNFKRDHWQRDVIISGFLSPLDSISKSKSRFDAPTNAKNSIRWLGEISREKVEKFRQAFKEHGLDLQWNSDRSESEGIYLFPPWLFDYPPVVYAARNHASKIGPGHWPAFELDKATVFLWKILKGCSTSSISLEADVLERSIEMCGLHRATIFLHILARFCDSMRQSKQFAADEIRELVFYPSDSEWKQPLGTLDPLKTNHQLLNLLTEIEAFSASQNLKFVEFKLQGPRILKGRLEGDSNFKSIFAYCGGRRDHRTKCGKHSLRLGLETWCESCGYLVCPDCKHCSGNCPNRPPVPKAKNLSKRGYDSDVPF